MARHLPISALFYCLLFSFPTSGSEPQAVLETLLQGESADTMAALVENSGGTITHHLPVIRAVGAKLTRGQLNAILDSGEVERHIDDLALAEQPENPHSEDGTQPNCKVAGSVAIEESARGFEWRLYNKGKKEAKLQSLHLKWPPALGGIQSLYLGGKPISVEEVQKTGEINIHDDSEHSLPPLKHANLRVEFERYPSPKPIVQSEFSLTATFSAGCEAKLIPGYPDNATDYYFSEVTAADTLHQQGVRGTGVTVAVLDSGLWEHPALTKDTAGRNRIPARYDAIEDEEPSVVFDESGHGTHLISALAHSGRTQRGGQPIGGYRGIAPDARVIPVKAFNEQGQGSMLNIVRGIQWVIDNREKYGIRVLNLSFAARPRWPYYLDPINQAVMQAWAAGIVVVAAAGNEGPEQMSVGSPGNTPYVITVGAVTDSWTPEDRSDDYIPDFSSRGPTPEAHIKPDIVAPGGHITGLIRPGSGLTLEHPEYMMDGDLFVLTGSSQAAAIVSGLAALLLQLEPDLSPDDVKCKLITGADPAINKDGLLAYGPFTQGHGYVNIVRAILIGERGCGNDGLNLLEDIAMKEHFEGPAIVNQEGKITLPNLSRMVSATPSEKGKSESRVWGVKQHIERLPENTPTDVDNPFQWHQQYQIEKQRVQRLGSESP